MASRNERLLEGGSAGEQISLSPATALPAEPAPGYARLIVTVALAGILVPLNSTMLAVALPEVRDDFAVSHAQLGWLISAYLIGMVLAQPVGGRIGDQVGRRTVLVWGLAGFLAMSLAAALSPSFWVLVGLRTGQALLGAALIPNGLALVREFAPATHLGRANGVTGSAYSLSAAVGPLVGAALLSVGSWRLLFAVNVPLVVVAMFFVLGLPKARPVSTRKVFVDWPGIALFGALLTFITYLLGSLRGVDDPLFLGIAALGAVVSLLLFVVRQLRGRQFTEWALFKTRSYSAATAQIFLTNLVMYTTLLSVPFFLREVQDKSSLMTGLLLGAMSLLMAAAAPPGGRLSDLKGRRLPAVVGSVLVLSGTLLLLLVLSEDVAPGLLAGGLAVLGLGVGLSSGAATTAAIESAPKRLAGSAAGANSMMRYLGSILGAGILAGILDTHADAPSIGTFRIILAVVAVMAALAVVTATFIHRFPPREPSG